MPDIDAINAFLQKQLSVSDSTEVTAIEAAKWLDAEGLLADSQDRPAPPLRNLLRAGKIEGQRQELNHRWYIDLVRGKRT